METKVRVLEIRASSNGWVVTTFEREVNWNAAECTPYQTYVAESAARASEIVGQLLDAEKWDQAVHIPPARAKII